MLTTRTQVNEDTHEVGNRSFAYLTGYALSSSDAGRGSLMVWHSRFLIGGDTREDLKLTH
jgi:hypothetical protein